MEKINAAATSESIADVNKEELRVLRSLDLTQKDFEGKVTLDLGSGGIDLAGYFKNNPKIKILSLDLKKPDKKIKNFIQADAIHLPIEDESVDFLVSMGGPVSIVEDRSKVEGMFNEIKRILKKNGEARLGFGWLNANIFESPKKISSVEEQMKHFKKESLEFIKSFGFSRVEEVKKGKNLYSFYYLIRN